MRHIVAKIKAKIISGEWDGEEKKDPFMSELISAYKSWYLSHTKARKRAIESQVARLERFREYLGDLRASKVSWFTIENYKSKRLKDGVSKATIN